MQYGVYAVCMCVRVSAGMYVHVCGWVCVCTDNVFCSMEETGVGASTFP